MSEKIKQSRPFFIFYVLVAYVFMQFGWWAYHIVDTNREVYRLREEILLLNKQNSLQLASKEKILEDKLTKRMWMVVGEGSVFLILLTFGAYVTQRAFKKEVALSYQQKNFLLSVTHELKSPLASIKLYLQTLLKRDLDKKKSEEIVKNALSDTERLNNLVEDILLTTRIESSSYPMQKKRINLSNFINDFISKIKDGSGTGDKSSGSFPGGKHEIITKIEPDVYFDGDKEAWNSILVNLVENAFKYSPENSTVNIELERKVNVINLRITDEGIGIADNKKHEIFKKFYRIENEETRKSKGTGLGLYIAKYLIEKHHGTISVKDNIPKGSIFELIFRI